MLPPSSSFFFFVSSFLFFVSSLPFLYIPSPLIRSSFVPRNEYPLSQSSIENLQSKMIRSSFVFF